MQPDLLRETPHRRFNPLKREWVLVSPHRAQRPWQGDLAVEASPESLTYDPNCYLCPGNPRASGIRNPNYSSTFVFENDFAALKPEAPQLDVDLDNKGLLRARSERGSCRVLCYSPNHALTLATMDRQAVRGVIDLWAEQYGELGARPDIQYVQIFENRGAMMGCSNPHPHGQIWANETIPNEPATEQSAQVEYFRVNKACLLCDYIQLEVRAAERLVAENEHFAAFVPFWATWPFEVLLLSRAHTPDWRGIDNPKRAALADILQRITIRYDNLFRTSFPYSMGFHSAPTDGEAHPEWHFHGHFFPPLLRSATVKKFMVGYELLASPQRDITPEVASERLRSQSEIHWKSSAPGT
jgi:UDPglucose--hexose-1-phosphate uridylyltransferase